MHTAIAMARPYVVTMEKFKALNTNLRSCEFDDEDVAKVCVNLLSEMSLCNIIAKYKDGQAMVVMHAGLVNTELMLSGEAQIGKQAMYALKDVRRITAVISQQFSRSIDENLSLQVFDDAGVLLDRALMTSKKPGDWETIAHAVTNSPFWHHKVKTLHAEAPMLKNHASSLADDLASIRDIGVKPIDENTVKAFRACIENIPAYATTIPSASGALEAPVHDEFNKVCARVLEAGREDGEPKTTVDISKLDADKLSQSLMDESQRIMRMLRFNEETLRTHQQFEQAVEHIHRGQSVQAVASALTAFKRQHRC
ncbi:hypothetical protein N9L68_04735 [bacterium]|nr:hypothetical protein [bacterium]